MGTIRKRPGKTGDRYTARVRLDGVDKSKTFALKSRAEAWIRAQEGAIETGSFKPTDPDAGKTFSAAIDLLLAHRAAVRRPPGATFAKALERMRRAIGDTPLPALTSSFWRRFALDRMADDGVASQTAVSDLLYAGSVIKHAKRELWPVDADAVPAARLQLGDEGLRLSSRQREGRIDDDALERLLLACDATTSHLPLGDIVRVALATAMRRGEVLSIRWSDLNGRVVKVRNRKHPKDKERVDDVPLMPTHPVWPLCDPLTIIKRQPRRPKEDRIFPFVADSVAERFEHAVAAAGLSGVVFHLLRHEALSRYAERGFDVLRLKLIGGHRDVRHLMRYVALDAGKLANEG